MEEDEMLRDWIPTLVVAAAFFAVLAVYAVLKLNGTEAGVLDDLLLLMGGAVAGVAAPTVTRRG